MKRAEIEAELKRLIDSGSPDLIGIVDKDGEYWSRRSDYGSATACIKNGVLGVFVSTLRANDEDCLGTEIDRFFPIDQISNLELEE